MPPGSPCPIGGKHPLVWALRSYIRPSSDSYDAEFAAAIWTRFPHWLEDTAAKNKDEMLALPPGAPRPSLDHPLGRALSRYTTQGKCKSNRQSYDPEFDAAIRIKQPHCFKR
jgi:hypothetical protein